jgi:hypothetical protein
MQLGIRVVQTAKKMGVCSANPAELLNGKIMRIFYFNPCSS